MLRHLAGGRDPLCRADGETRPGTAPRAAIACVQVLVRDYQPGDERRILESFNLVFREVCGAGYVDRDLATWRWMFADNPHGHRILLAVDTDGTVAAQYAALPYAARTPLGPTTFSQIVDSFVHPDYRRGLKRPGIFVQTAGPALEQWIERGDGLLYGYPVRAAERVGQRYLQYSMLRVVDFLVRSTDGNPPPVAGDLEVGPLAGLEEPALEAEVSRLAQQVIGSERCAIERTPSYLDWRYCRSPSARYEFLAARRDNALCGLAVLRAEHDTLVPGACAIAEWMLAPGDTAVADALLAATLERARAAGRTRLLAILPEPCREYAHLRARGFDVVASADTLERRLTYRVGQPGLTPEVLAAHWYYTLGDSDLV